MMLHLRSYADCESPDGDMKTSSRDSYVNDEFPCHESDSTILSTRSDVGWRQHHRIRNKGSVGDLKRIDIVFSHDSVSRKGSESCQNKPVIQQKPAQPRSGPSQRPIRSAYRRTLERESASALAFLSTCNTEIENEIHFLEGELAAFRRLEEAQLAEMEDLKIYAPQTRPLSLQIQPPPSPPRATAPAQNKAAFANEAPSQSCGAGPLARAQLPATMAVSAGNVSAGDGAEPEQHGGRTGWCGGGWKKALRKRP